MRTFELGDLEIVPEFRRRTRGVAVAGWAAPGLALAGTVTGALAADGCDAGIALPVSGLALTVAGALLWLTGLPRARRDRIALAIAAALGMLTIAALQQLLACALGREAMLVAELLQAGGLILLFGALLLALHRRRRVHAPHAEVTSA